MSYALEVIPAAQRDLERLPADMRERVRDRVEALIRDPCSPRSEELTGEFRGLRKSRVGDYRVVYQVDEPQREMILWGVAHRSRIYDVIRRRLR